MIAVIRSSIYRCGGCNGVMNITCLVQVRQDVIADSVCAYGGFNISLCAVPDVINFAHNNCGCNE